MAGIKETEQFLGAVNEVVLLLIELFKDGVQLNDFVQMYLRITNDPKFKGKLQEAYEDYEQIPAELKDLDASEIVALTSMQINYLPKILQLLKD